MVQVKVNAFEKMNKLRLLSLDYVHLSTGYEHISKRLVWLRWKGFPLKCVPSNLPMENLVSLDLSYSRLKQVWKGTMVQQYSYHLEKSITLYMVKITLVITIFFLSAGSSKIEIPLSQSLLFPKENQ